MELYKPFKSKAKNKKYSVYVKGGKLIHFGDKRYGQYKDKIGLYSHLDHNDKKKRESYHSRFGPATDKNTAKYWSHKILSKSFVGARGRVYKTTRKKGHKSQPQVTV